MVIGKSVFAAKFKFPSEHACRKSRFPAEGGIQVSKRKLKILWEGEVWKTRLAAGGE